MSVLLVIVLPLFVKYDMRIQVGEGSQSAQNKYINLNV